MSHIPDHELLLVAEDELDTARAEAVFAHLQECAACRDRQAEILFLLGAAFEVHMDQELPPIDGARALLRDRLRPSPKQRYLALAALAAALVLVAIPFLPQGNESASPRAALTPGSVVAISQEAMCAMNAETDRPAIAPAVAAEVFRRYGIHEPQPRAYEVDYLIPPDLGGSVALQNLWPQPYAEGKWNARVKDALEDRLRTMVCNGKLELGDAQRDLADDWIAAYKKYFGSANPLPDHLAFVKDRPWE